MIIRKTPEQVDKMAAAGEILVRCLHMLASQGAARGDDQGARPGRGEADPLAGRRAGLQGLPWLPRLDLRLAQLDGRARDPRATTSCKRGDVLSIDVGVIKDGWVADAAMTVPIGPIEPEARKLLDVTKASLFAGVEQMQPGNQLGDVSAAIQRAVEIEGLSIIRTLVGHGIGREMHEDPQVPNFGTPGKGPVLEEGTVLAIEPMVNAGGAAGADGR